jgi:hypothetical protein
LWLLAHNKLLTRDNLSKRKNVDDLTCVFCNEIESCQHLFFECVVVSSIWAEVKKVLEFHPQIRSITDISALWKDKKKHSLVNMLIAAILRTIWLTRNDMVFNRTQWIGMQVLWRKVACILAQWKILLKEEERGMIKILSA